MKILGRLFAICVLVGVIAAGVVYFNPTLRTRATVAGQVWGLNLGIIKVKDADWGYLKLRSGTYGVEALRDLERHGATDQIKMAAVAVQTEWFEKGHHFDGSFFEEARTLDHETRFSELHMPKDGKLLRQDLTPGQVIPESFWQSRRFRTSCALPPPTRESHCVLRMMDLSGDGRPEIVVETFSVGDPHDYAEPVVRLMWEVYSQHGDDWDFGIRYPFCEAAPGSTPKVLANMDMPRFNDQAADFFRGKCWAEDNMSLDPVGQGKRAAGFADKLGDIAVVYPQGGQLPASLRDALAAGKVSATAHEQVKIQLVPPSARSPGFTTDSHPFYAGYPPCFISYNAKGCTAIVADLDHDGMQDVVILDGEIRTGMEDYRIATLLMSHGGHWSVVASDPVCADDVPDIHKPSFSAKANAWLPVSFGGRILWPKDSMDKCLQHTPVM